MPIVTTLLISAAVAASACFPCVLKKLDGNASASASASASTAVPAPSSGQAPVTSSAPSSAVAPSVEPAPSAEPATTSAVIEYQDDVVLLSTGAAPVVWENAVFVNAAAARAMNQPEAEPVSSVVCESMVVANTMGLTATETDGSVTTTASASASPSASASADDIADTMASVITVEERLQPSHLDQYARKVSQWAGLTEEQEYAAGMILENLDTINNGSSFSALRDPMDVVGVVCRSVVRLGDDRARKHVFGHWLPQYQDLELSVQGQCASEVKESDVQFQRLLSDWCLSPVAVVA